ncbi:MAG TPA: hypothetical protein DEA55_06145 [Rhodospirillaceae bacterium]|nr:hypothetical protein [Rhodospirillaceae bacterium]
MNTRRNTNAATAAINAPSSAKIISFKKFLTLATIITLSAGSVQAFELEDSASSVETAERSALVSDFPSSAMADSCLPLLKSIHETTSVSAMDRNQRSAGKAAALGVVFGVRFALGPKEVAKPRHGQVRLDLWQTASSISDNNRHALAISDYRACRKEKALNALSEFRWQR